jgi:hypothetical protein
VTVQHIAHSQFYDHPEIFELAEGRWFRDDPSAPKLTQHSTMEWLSLDAIGLTT